MDTVIPGAHPSSEGKRRRNRSNVEAMAAKHNNPGAEESVEAGTGDTGGDIGKQENHRDLSTNGEYQIVMIIRDHVTFAHQGQQ